MDPGIREVTVTVLVSLYTLTALSTSEPWRRNKKEWVLCCGVSFFACGNSICKMFVYLVIVSQLILQNVSVGPVWLRPRERDGVWGTAQLVHHGNCAGNYGRQQWCDMRDLMVDQLTCFTNILSSLNCVSAELCWCDSDHTGAVLQNLKRIFSRAWRQLSKSFYGAPTRIQLQSLCRLADRLKGTFPAFHLINNSESTHK